MHKGYRWALCKQEMACKEYTAQSFPTFVKVHLPSDAAVGLHSKYYCEPHGAIHKEWGYLNSHLSLITTCIETRGSYSSSCFSGYWHTFLCFSLQQKTIKSHWQFPDTRVAWVLPCIGLPVPMDHWSRKWQLYHSICYWWLSIWDSWSRSLPYRLLGILWWSHHVCTISREILFSCSPTSQGINLPSSLGCVPGQFSCLPSQQSGC